MIVWLALLLDGFCHADLRWAPGAHLRASVDLTTENGGIRSATPAPCARAGPVRCCCEGRSFAYACGQHPSVAPQLELRFPRHMACRFRAGRDLPATFLLRRGKQDAA